ncbi:hypothetical protein CVT25_007478 [Psilocybe cyanescens]|uniref:Uncharacterized protein n=1 Tax=Psilocybe cyanescens TaxID=93625 RepID=A0A409XVR8_PSICY|nr:hypothetical protein CVT25_007478 [Psilocybe cyanescens]
MSYRKARTEKPSKPIIYRTRHKILKDLREEDTTHGFVERMARQSPNQAAAMQTSQPAFCGVLGDDISDSIQMTANNYRKVARELQNRVRSSRIAMTSENPADISTATSNRLTCPTSDCHMESGKDRSFDSTEDYPHAGTSQTSEDTQGVGCEEEHPTEYFPAQHDLWIRYVNAVNTGFNIYPYYEPNMYGSLEHTVQAPQGWYRSTEESNYQAPVGSSHGASFNPFFFAPSAPSQLTLFPNSWEASVEDPGFTVSYQDLEPQQQSSLGK